MHCAVVCAPTAVSTKELGNAHFLPCSSTAEVVPCSAIFQRCDCALGGRKGTIGGRVAAMQLRVVSAGATSHGGHRCRLDRVGPSMFVANVSSAESVNTALEVHDMTDVARVAMLHFPLRQSSRPCPSILCLSLLGLLLISSRVPFEQTLAVRGTCVQLSSCTSNGRASDEARPGRWRARRRCTRL